MTEAFNTDAINPPSTKILSPFLPNTNVMYAWDSTCLGLLKTCPRLYEYVIIQGWSSSEESIHLRFGIEYHKALEDYDRSKAAGIPHDDAIHDTVRALLARTFDFAPDLTSKAGKYKNRTSLLRTVIDYLDHFADDPAKTYILDDGRPAVELSFRFELDWGPNTQAGLKVIESNIVEPKIEGGVQWDEHEIKAQFPPFQPYLLSGHLDRVVTFQDALFVMDRKTTTTTPSDYYFNQFEPNNQMSLYTLASQIVLKSPIKGVIIDAAQILIGSSRFVRGFTYRTRDSIEEWTDDLRYWFSLAEQFAINDYWPQNDMSCDKYGGCRFRTICSKSPQVREQFLKSSFTKLEPSEKWNPLKPR